MRNVTPFACLALCSLLCLPSQLGCGKKAKDSGDEEEPSKGKSKGKRGEDDKASRKKKARDEDKPAARGNGEDDEGDKGDKADKAAGAGCKLPDDGVHADFTIRKGCSVKIATDLHIEEGATLTLEPGVKLAFEAGVLLSINYGRIVAKGTEDEPIVFTSSNKSPGPGDWAGLRFFEKTSAGNVLDHVVIEYAGKDNYGNGALRVYGEIGPKRIAITHSVFRNNAGAAIGNEHDKSLFEKVEGNTFKSNEGTSLLLAANVMGSIGENKFGDPIRIAGTIGASQTWPALDVPVIITGDMHLSGEQQAAILTVPDKAVLKFAAGAMLAVGEGNGGGIVAKGVTFTSANATAAAGDWAGIRFFDKATSTSLVECIFEYAGKDNYGKGAVAWSGIEASSTKGVKLEKNIFRHNAEGAMSSENGCGDAAKPAAGNKSEGAPLCIQ